eukprot:SAG22_NODE_54_length_23787_cov_12.917511_20_plen_158_part_00
MARFLELQRAGGTYGMTSLASGAQSDLISQNAGGGRVFVGLSAAGLLAAGLLSHEEAEEQWLLDSAGALTIKLHATIVNSKRGGGGGAAARGAQAAAGGAKVSRGRPHFDARPMLALPARTDSICDCPLRELHLSSMAGGRGQPDGYYNAAHVLPLT